VRKGIGTRLFGKAKGLDYNVEVVAQFGKFAGSASARGRSRRILLYMGARAMAAALGRFCNAATASSALVSIFQLPC